MRKYTTITVNKSVLMDLENVKNEINARSLGETIEFLIMFWRRARAREFAREIMEVRKIGGLDEVKNIISEVRGLRWVRST